MTKESLFTLALQEVPSVIGLLKTLFAKAHPGQPAPTDADVIAAYQSAFISSMAKDDAWLAAHPRG